MEEEYIFTGYCRATDGSRVVTVETDGAKIEDIGCGFGNCPHQPSCPIAQKIREIQ